LYLQQNDPGLIQRWVFLHFPMNTAAMKLTINLLGISKIV
jgi:hypothetical protein